MTARTALVLVALTLIPGRAQAGRIDKAKLRKLAKLPEVSVIVGVEFSSTFGFSFNGDKPDPLAEIARVHKQLKGDPSDVERYLRLGRLYHKTERKKESEQAYAKAVSICRQQVREHPDDMRRLAQLGDALVSNDEIKEGEKLLRRAVKEAPNEWRAWLALGECVDVLAAQALFGEKGFSFHLLDAKVVIPQLLEQKPTAKQIADLRRMRKEARNCYDRAIELAPREVKPYFRRIGSNGIYNILEAGLRAVKGEKVNMLAATLTPECAADMGRIARLAPDDPKGVGSAVLMQLLACVLNKKLEVKGDPSSFADILAAKSRSVVELLPAENRKTVRWGMERLEQLTKKPDKATAAAASEILADVLMVLNRIDEERGLPSPWSMAPPLKDEDGGVPVPSPQEEEDAASKILEHLSRAVVLDPSRDRAWDMLTLLLAEKKKIGKAVAMGRERVRIKDNAHNRFLLAKLYADDDQFREAAEQLRAGLKSDSTDMNCRLGLIAVLLKRDDAEALKEAGKQLDALEARIKQEKSKEHERSCQLPRGLHAALSNRPERANELFRQILQQHKGDTSAAQALAALGEPLTPADRQLALDYLQKQGADFRGDGEQADSPVESITLGHKSTEADLFFLTAFPRLRALDLSRAPITDAGLARLKVFTDLQRLDLGDTKITDKGLIHLKALTKLRDLSLRNTKIGDAGLAHLEHLRNLERLSLYDSSSEEKYNITDAGLAHLRKLTKLRDVSVGSYLTDEGLAHLAALPRLRKLFMIYCKVTDDGMKHFERLTELEELWLSGTEIGDAGVAHLKGLRRLWALHLGSTKITDAGLVHLKGLSRLEELELEDTAITDAGLVHLRGLINLRQLNLGDSKRVMGALLEKFLPEKQRAKERITSAGLKHLQGLTKLKILDLDGHPITDAGLSDIEKLTQIEFLSLDTTNITDVGLASLHRLKKLESVNVSGTKVTRQGIAELRKVFPKLQVYR